MGMMAGYVKEGGGNPADQNFFPTSPSQLSQPRLALADAQFIVGAKNTLFPVASMAAQISNSYASWKPTVSFRSTSP
jgi:hypothetical protein